MEDRGDKERDRGNGREKRVRYDDIERERENAKNGREERQREDIECVLVCV